MGKIDYYNLSKSDVSLEKEMSEFKDFLNRQPQNIEVSLERGSAGTFKQQHISWRKSFIPNRYVDLNTLELPFNSVLHVLDNLYKTTISDTIRMDNPLIVNEQSKIFLSTVIEPELDGPLKVVEETFVYRTMGISKRLAEFRAQNLKKFRMLSSVNEIADNATVLYIVNHNPFFKARYFSPLLVEYRKITNLLVSILNTVCKFPNKDHFVQIEIKPIEYKRNLILKTTNEITRATVGPLDEYFIILMHVLNFINRDATTSIFSGVPTPMWEKINLIFFKGSKGFIYNLKELYDMNSTTNDMLPRVLKQFNQLALESTPLVKIEKEYEEVADGSIELKSVKYKSTPMTPISHTSRSPEQSEIILPEDDNKLTESTTVIIPQPENNSDKNKKQFLELEKTVSLLLEKENSTKNITKALTDTVLPTLKIIDEITSAMTMPKTEIEIYETVDDKLIVTQRDNLTKGYDVTGLDETLARSSLFIEELDAGADLFIAIKQDLTIAQKDRYAQKSRVYKTVKLGDLTLDEILTKKTDSKLEKKSLQSKDFEELVPDKSMLKSSINNFNDEYLSKSFDKDLVSVLTSFSRNGLYLQDIQTKEIRDTLSHIKEYAVKYEDINGKATTIHFTIPLVDKDGNCKVNGVKKRIKPQMVALPIYKIGASRVSLSSNYNKVLVERNVSKYDSFKYFIQKLIKEIDKDGKLIEVSLGGTEVNSNAVAFDYSSMASLYRSIKFPRNEDLKSSVFFNFDYGNRAAHWSRTFKKLEMHQFEMLYGTFCGHMDGLINIALFIDLDNNLRMVNIETNEVFVVTSIISLIMDNYLKGKIVKKSSYEYVDLNILNKKFPVIFVLAFRFGLANVFKYLDLKYVLLGKYNDNHLKSLRGTSIVIEFSDKYLVFDRYPLAKSLIVSGLSQYNTKKHDINEFNEQDVFYKLLSIKDISPNYLKGINGFFDFFSDPMTIDILRQMKEPTEPLDLLIRAAQLLSTEDFREVSSTRNHRIRTFEKIPAVIYNEISRQLASHNSSLTRKTRFTINPKGIYQRIIQDPSMAQVDELNPVHSMKEVTDFTYSGVGGRTTESFVIADRIYPKDGVGIISETTPASSSVGMNAGLSADPSIINIRGFLDAEGNVKKLDPAQVLSNTNLLIPSSTNDDPKRMNFNDTQISHVMPTVSAEVSRFGTGKEYTVSHDTVELFSDIAKANGIVSEIDNKLKLMTITYDDNARDIIDFSIKNTDSGGINITQNKVLNVPKIGHKFKKEDVLTYNPDFFEKDFLNPTQVAFKLGVKARVALMETAGTYEDGCTISRSLGERLDIEPVHRRIVTLEPSSQILKFVKIGSLVKVNDPIMTFMDSDPLLDEEKYSDKELELFELIDKKIPLAKHSGEVVDIEVFYNVNLTDMSSSIKTFVNTIDKIKSEKFKKSRNTMSANNFIPPSKLPNNAKFKGVSFDVPIIAIIFYIREDKGLSAGIGDKIVLATSLKSIISDIDENPIVSKSGVEIDMTFSGSGLNNRVVLAPFIAGMTERIMKQLEENVINMWNKN